MARERWISWATRVGADDPVTVTLLNLAPALINEFDMQSRIQRSARRADVGVAPGAAAGASSSYGTADVPDAGTEDAGPMPSGRVRRLPSRSGSGSACGTRRFLSWRISVRRSAFRSSP